MAPNFYFSNDWKKRMAPLVDVLAHKSTESQTHTRGESYMTRIEAKWKGTNQPGETNPDTNWKEINDLIGVVMAGLSQAEGGDQNFRVTSLAISVAGRRLAVLGTAAVSDAKANDVANNADMATFVCDFIEFKGSQRAEQAAEGLFLKEVRNFEIHAWNGSDDSVFPVLSFDGGDTLNWAFTAGGIGPEPGFWIVERSVDGIVWLPAAPQPAGTRMFDIGGSGQQLWRVKRSDDGVNPLVPESNIVPANSP